VQQIDKLTTAKSILLDLIFNQGIRIGVIAQDYRTAKEILYEVEKMTLEPQWSIFLQHPNIKSRKGSDFHEICIGDSTVTALPASSAICGYRFDRVIATPPFSEEFIKFVMSCVTVEFTN